MRHKKLGRQFGRDTSHRRAMFRALAANLVLHERIETTDAKAKELRRIAERLVTRAVRLGNVAFTAADKLSPAERGQRTSTKRFVGRFLQRFGTKPNAEGENVKIDLLEKLLVELGTRYQNRPGGYTRIVKVGRRRGDNAPMSIIEFVKDSDAKAAAPKPPKKAAAAPAEGAASPAA
jgi:large subunit ribosomal protein L17